MAFSETRCFFCECFRFEFLRVEAGSIWFPCQAWVYFISWNVNSFKSVWSDQNVSFHRGGGKEERAFNLNLYIYIIREFDSYEWNQRNLVRWEDKMLRLVLWLLLFVKVELGLRRSRIPWRFLPSLPLTHYKRSVSRCGKNIALFFPNLKQFRDMEMYIGSSDICQILWLGWDELGWTPSPMNEYWA